MFQQNELPFHVLRSQRKHSFDELLIKYVKLCCHEMTRPYGVEIMCPVDIIGTLCGAKGIVNFGNVVCLVANTVKAFLAPWKERKYEIECDRVRLFDLDLRNNELVVVPYGTKKALVHKLQVAGKTIQRIKQVHKLWVAGQQPNEQVSGCHRSIDR